jgi:hypothetical protein
VLGYIGASVAAHLREGGHAATTITGHKAMSDDVAIYAPPVAAQAVTVPPGLVDALRHQRQCDEDGTDCIVSRQAVCVAADILAALTHPKAAPCDAQGAE